MTLVEALQESNLPKSAVLWLHRILKEMGMKEPYPTEEQLLATLSIMGMTLVLYYIFFGKRHKNRRELLATKLADAERRMSELQAQFDAIDSDDENDIPRKPIRVWMDGAFDMMHYGHMNAFRQGRSLGTYLVVGINSDESITACKGTPPVLNDEERTTAVEGCKWVDEVVSGAPYVMTPEYLNMVIEKYSIDYVVHGDDPCIVDGKDVYEDAKNRGIYRSIPRTEGVSTTDIVGRMLYMSRDHHDKLPSHRNLVSKERKRSNSVSSETSDHLEIRAEPFFRPSQFLTTSRMLRIFSAGARDPPKGAKVVYVDGAFDMFHMGHVRTLQKARALGDYLIVGVHNDNLVNQHRGSNYPIMNLNERLLSVLGCTYVNDVLIDAPWDITREMIASLNISVVAHGSSSDHVYEQTALDAHYDIPKSLGILQSISSDSELCVDEIVRRILENEKMFKAKVAKKMQAEGEYYSERYGFDTSKNTK